MGHGPAADWGEDNAVKYKTKVGIILFFVYCTIYSGFVAINALNPSLMSIKVIFGLNLACVYGFGLIVLAIVMGTIYNAMCTRAEDMLNKKGDAK